MPGPQLKIRAEQMTVMAAEVERNILDKTTARYVERYPDIPGLRDRIAAIVKRADRYGLPRSGGFLDWFIELDLNRGFEWELAPGFDSALFILNDPVIDPSGRRFRLEKLLRRFDASA